jgi:hypothetical protein
VGSYLSDEEMASSKEVLASVLDQGVPVLLYNGNFDFTIPPNGVENWILSMKWKGQMGTSQLFSFF